MFGRPKGTALAASQMQKARRSQHVPHLTPVATDCCFFCRMAAVCSSKRARPCARPPCADGGAPGGDEAR